MNALAKSDTDLLLDAWDWPQQARPEQLLPPGDWTYWLIMAGRGWGKALALDTPIATPDGWATMGALRDGDTVFDNTGKPCRVIRAHDVLLGRNCYRVRFNDGSSIVADAEHLWETSTHVLRKAERRRVDGRHWPARKLQKCVISTARIAETITYGKRGDLNHSVELCGALALPERPLPIDPYVLGAWLGDGSAKEAAITFCDADFEEFRESFRSAGFGLRMRPKRAAACATYAISNGSQPARGSDGRMLANGSLHSKLKALGVFGNKHVPPEYLRASAQQRLALLQGLMDTDGTCSADCSQCSFDNTNERLADAVYELVVSLGMRATRRQKRASLYDKNCGICCRVTFRPTRPVFRLTRKLARISATKSQASRHAHRMIVAVEPVDSVPVRCITVDSPSHLYLAGESMVPTHNTRAGAEAVREWIALGHNYVNLIGATADDARDIMVQGESGILAVCPVWERPEYKSSQRKLIWPNGAESLIFTADEPERLRGKQSERLWCDELAAWRYAESWDQALLGLRLGRHPQAVITTTPRPTKIVREIIADPATVITRGNTRENRANLAPSFFDAILKRYEGTRLGRQEIAGELLDDNPGALFKRADIDAARVLLAPAMSRIVVAIDPAATSFEGSDDTGIVAAGAAGDDGYVLADLTVHGSPEEWARVAVKAYHDLKADRIVAEGNNGGEMVASVIRAVDRNVPVTIVHATRGKAIRAEPVAALYEQHRIHHVGQLPQLEDQMVEWNPADETARSPDRMDALVWAITDLMLEDNNTGLLEYYRMEAEKLKRTNEPCRN